MATPAVTELVVRTLLCVVVVAGMLALVFRDLLVSVILLSALSFLSAVLLYVMHAPDVAITEAAVGAGVTALIFAWAVHTCTTPGNEPGNHPPGVAITSLKGSGIADLVLVAGLGVCLYALLPSLDGSPATIRDHLTYSGYADTGARNLVSAVYLGYRAFDTFGETIVLLCAVNGSIYLLSRTS